MNFLMKNALVFVLSLGLSSHWALANMENYNSDYLEKHALANVQLMQLKDQIDNPPSNDDNFIFVAVLPSAMAATLDLILMAGAAGYVSYQLQQELELELNNIDLSLLSPLQAYRNLKAIFTRVETSADRFERSADRLKEVGYTNGDLEVLKATIAEKSSMCSNKQNNNSPDNFCPGFQDSFARDGYKISKKNGGWMVTKKGKFQCCLEWDNLHCGFEIFDKKGRHKGEVGCLPDEFNPCEHNPARGQHALPQKDHKPRSGACQK